jgi:peptidyl-dipeptidase Dcp
MHHRNAPLAVTSILAASLLTMTHDSPAAQPGLTASNPFAAVSPLPLHYPQFDRIRDTDFSPAFDAGMAEQLAEVRAIADNPAAPTFDNTMVALERSGQVLDRAQTVFYNLVGADTNDARNKLRSDYAPRFSAHSDAILLDGKLFARIESLHSRRAALGLDAEAVRLIERYHSDFVRAGAKLSAADKEKLKTMNAELATLGSRFTQNVLDEVNASAVVVDDVKQLDGFTPAQIEAAAQEAKSRNLPGKYVITLLNTTGQPPESQLTHRPLRQRLHEASIHRGAKGGQWDNREIVSRTMKLRAERAPLLGFPNYATYGLEDQTARTPEAVNDMLSAARAGRGGQCEARSRRRCRRSSKEGSAETRLQAGALGLAYYTEKVRSRAVRLRRIPAQALLRDDNVLENGVFYAANQLYGLTFKRAHRSAGLSSGRRARVRRVRRRWQAAGDLPERHVRARQSKRGGAWMNEYVSQSGLTGYLPVVANHLNVPKPPAGEPTLLTWDEVTTAFHEFGHALHGMFSSVRTRISAAPRAARLRGVPVTGQRNVGRLAGRAEELRQALPDRRTAAAGSCSTR